MIKKKKKLFESEEKKRLHWRVLLNQKLKRCLRRYIDELQDRGIFFKIAYTNVDEVLLATLELNDYLKEKKPDILYMVDTNLNKGGRFLM